jgi:hypothetical protein
MVRIVATLILVSLLGVGLAVAQNTCATKAVSKDGKPLSAPGNSREGAERRHLRFFFP